MGVGLNWRDLGWQGGLVRQAGCRAGSLGAALSTAFFYLGCYLLYVSWGAMIYCRDGKRYPGHEPGNLKTSSSSQQVAFRQFK